MNKVFPVLKALMKGIPVPYNGYVFRLDEDNELCTEGYRYENGELKPWDGILLKTDISLKNFIDMCKNMSDDEIFLLNANNVLNELNRKH